MKQARTTLAVLIAALAVIASTALSALAGATAGSGVVGSVHDITAFAAIQPGGAVQADNEQRVCVFCHTPHHADMDGIIGPLWSHKASAKTYIPYKTTSFDSDGNMVYGDPLWGSSRLCMSCHDGQIAIDSHDGSGTTQSGGFVLSGSKVVGSDSSPTSDHPIGINYDMLQTANPTKLKPSTNMWMSGNGQKIEQSLENGGWMTCNSCHEVHNKKNVAQVVSADGIQRSWLLRAQQKNSALCRSCHNM